jgi:hypothetical protein
MTAPHRRWSVFSLRTLFVVPFILASAFSVFDAIRSRQREQEALADFADLNKEHKLVTEALRHFQEANGRRGEFIRERGLGDEYDERWRGVPWSANKTGRP